MQEKSNRVKKAEICPNCDQKLQGENFCPNCGQRNDIRRIRFRHFIAESLSNFFAVDGRFIHTLVVLFTRPGRVPKDYIHGKRQCYVHPVRIYFLSSILLLFMIQYSGGSDEIVKINETDPEAEEVLDSLNIVTDFDTARDSVLAEFSNGEETDTGAVGDQQESGKIERMMEHYNQTGETDAALALVNAGLTNNLWNRFLYTQSIKISEFDDREFSRYFFSKFFWVLFFFLPFLAGVHHLLYLRRKFYYPEHLFFTFYNQTVFFLTIIVGYAVAYLTHNQGILVPFVLGFMIYQYLALRRFYGQKAGKTLLKFIILNILTIPLFGIFFIIAALITFIFF